MRIILKYVLTNVRERKARTAVMLLSIVLSATLLLVSFSIGASYESAQRKMARGMAGSASVSVAAARGSIGLDELPRLPSIKASVGMVEGSALYHENGYYETLDLIAADLGQLKRINPPRLPDGGELRGFSGDEVVLPERFTKKYSIEAGDTITIELSGNPVRLRVAQVAAYDTVFLRHTRGATALLPLPTLAGLLGTGDGYSEILLEPAAGVSAGELAAELTAALPPGGYRVSEVVDEARVAADARQKSMPFFLISFFSLTMSVFIIYSSYQVITLERLPVIGTFRCIGATQGAVTRILLLESLLYGGVGALAGIPVGMLVLRLVLRGMGRSLAQGIEIPVVVPPVGVIASLGVAVAASALSAWIPVRRASRLPVKEVVLGMVEERRVPRRLVACAGAALLAVSLVLPQLAEGRLLYLAGGCSLLGLIGAAILLVPLLTDLLCVGLERIYGAALGNEGWLAARNLRGNRNIQQNITLLFISISAVIAITVVGDFVSAYVGDVFRGAEMDGFADGEMGEAFIKRVERMEGVEKVLPLHVFENSIEADGVPLLRLEGTGRQDWYCPMLAIEGVEGTLAFPAGRAVLLSGSCMERTGFSVGDTLTLSDGTVRRDYRVVGGFQSRATDVEAVIASSFAVSDFGADGYQFLAYSAADPEAVMVQIRDLFGDTQNWSRTVEEFNRDALSTVGTFLQPMHSMTGFILLLAAVGVVNNLLINQIQKRRATAVYRAVGLSSRQNWKITLLEGLTSGLIGAAVAMLVSYWEIRTIFLVAGPKIRVTPEWNAAIFWTAGLLGVGVTLLGSLVPLMKGRLDSCKLPWRESVW